MALWYRQRQNRETTFGAVNYVSILYLVTDFTFLTENDKAQMSLVNIYSTIIHQAKKCTEKDKFIVVHCYL